MSGFGELRSILAGSQRDALAFKGLCRLVSQAWEEHPEEVEQAWIPYAQRELESWDDRARVLKCVADVPQAGFALARRASIFFGDLSEGDVFWLDGWTLPCLRVLQVLSGTVRGAHLEQFSRMHAPHLESLTVRLDATPDELGAFAGALAFPALRTLEVSSNEGVGAFIEGMVGAVQTDRLESVTLMGNAVEPDVLDRFASMPFGSLRRLDLGGLCSDAASVDALCSRRWPGVELLRLSDGGLGDDAIERLVASGAFPDVATLDLSGNGFGARGVFGLMGGEAFPNLLHLDLSANNAMEDFDEAVVSPGSAGEVAALESLSIAYSEYDGGWFEPLLSGARCRSLRRLVARFTGQEDALVAALTSSGLHERLEELELANTHPSVEGHDAWLRGVVWSRLRRLDLGAHRLTPETTASLVAQEFPALESLSFRGATIQLWPLTEAPWFSRLRELDLSMTPTTDMDLTLLASLDDLALEVLDVGRSRSYQNYAWERLERSYGDAGVLALTGAVGLGNLRELHLDATELTAEAWRALATTSALPSLERVHATVEYDAFAQLTALAAGPEPVGAWVHELLDRGREFGRVS